MKRNDELPRAQTIDDVLVKGDLSALTPQQRTEYYLKICDSLGLNPMTQPFSYITLNGKLVLYALRACADQLRKLNGISIEIVSQELKDGLLSVHVRARDKHGRTDEDLGVVAVGHLKGEAAANGILKAVTKAKRRVTLSISGLGYLDETEVDDIPAKAKGPVIADNPIQPQAIEAPSHNEETGEIMEGPHQITVPATPDGKGSNWIAYGQKLISAISSSKSADEINTWLTENLATLEEMKKAAPKAYASVMRAKEKNKTVGIPNPADDPEGYFNWLIAQCKAVNNIASLDMLADHSEQYTANAFPPDVAHARGIIALRRNELEKAS
jgi:hypothetical protein